MAKTKAQPLSTLFGAAEVPSSARLRMALDVLDPLAKASRVPSLVARKAGSRFVLENVQVAVRGRSKLTGRGNRSGLHVLVWEILAGQPAPAKPPPLSALDPDVDPNVDALLCEAIANPKGIGDAAELSKRLVIASAGLVGDHRDVAKLLAQVAKAEDTKVAAAKRATKKNKVGGATGASDEAPTKRAGELDDAVAEALEQLGDDWGLGAQTIVATAVPPAAPPRKPAATPPPQGGFDIDDEDTLPSDGITMEQLHAQPASAPASSRIEDPETYDGDDLIEEIIADEEQKKRAAAEGSLPPRRTPPPLPQRSRGTARPDVLFIATDAATSAHYGGALRRAGLSVEVCDDIDLAVSAACTTQPRCVVLDADSSDVDGAEVAYRARNNSPRACLAPFVFLTGDPKAAKKTKGRLGAKDTWMRKPVPTDALLEHVQQFAQAEEIARASERPPSIGPPEGDLAMRGDLAHISMRTVIAMLELERQTGVLAIESSQGRAKLILSAGQPTQVTVLGRRMRPADGLATVSLWEDGEFAFHPTTDLAADRWMPKDLAPRTSG